MRLVATVTIAFLAFVGAVFACLGFVDPPETSCEAQVYNDCVLHDYPQGTEQFLSCTLTRAEACYSR